MILIVGLGNPGEDYTGTRHNIGFQILDRLKADIGCGSEYSKFNSLACSAELRERKLLLIKPQTYMNNSGTAVLSFYKFLGDHLESILVIHDDIDIDLGQIRLKSGGGTAGHRGLESIALKLGGEDFDRLRFGVGRPPGRMDASDYVLRKFARAELEEVQFSLEKSVGAVRDYIGFGIDCAMNRYNT